jgi:deoxycytidylate deaminase
LTKRCVEEGDMSMGEYISPPLIVLGLTGPLGSGCTSLSHLFDIPGKPRTERNKLFSFLEAEHIIKAESNQGFKFKIDWQSINEKIDQCYEKRSKVSLTREDENYEEKYLQMHGEIGRELEKRESLHGLDFLEPYYTPQGHLFRTISVSDLIVFHTLLSFEKRNRIQSIPEKYRCFFENGFNDQLEVVVKSLKRAEISSFSEYYNLLYEDLDSAMLDKITKAFGWIHGVARRIKNCFKNNSPQQYTRLLQDFGDNIRRTGDPFNIEDTQLPQNAYLLAKDISQMIRQLHKRSSGAFFIVDCLRNPYEVMYLHQEFANFYLVSLYADKFMRKKRVIEQARSTWGSKFNEINADMNFEEADKRDSGKDIKKEEDELYCQNVPKCVQISDIALNNDTKDRKERGLNAMYRKFLRYLCLILNPGCTKPKGQEIFMNMAYTMAVKSNCISRQVGAVVVGPKGYVVGAGWNDVPFGTISCGLRAIRDLINENEFLPLVNAIKKDGEDTDAVIDRLTRDLCDDILQKEDTQQFCFCFKDEITKHKAVPKLNRAWDNIVENDIHTDQDKASLKEAGKILIHKLVERGHLHQLDYCLALHAEENAIVQSAKIGGMGLKGGTIYSTALPCTLCSKKIQQIGLKKVIYTEPYPDSLSDIYMKGIKAEQFEGVKPRSYIKMFMPYHEQKEWQKLKSKQLTPLV